MAEADLDTVMFKDLILPPKEIRFGGMGYKDDEYFMSTARAEADRLVRNFGLTIDSSILEVGCGPGRLATGILDRVGDVKSYRAVDVDERSICWCRQNITPAHPTFQFTHLDLRNDRYNPDGRLIDSGFRMPFDDQEFDIIYLFSVFSHMVRDDVEVYLNEFRRLLSPSGKIFLTAFIEDNVDPVTLNPTDYKPGVEWQGPLHCVRYERSFFESMLAKNGFQVDHSDYEDGNCGQCILYISRRADCDS